MAPAAVGKRMRPCPKDLSAEAACEAADADLAGIVRGWHSNPAPFANDSEPGCRFDLTVDKLRDGDGPSDEILENKLA